MGLVTRAAFSKQEPSIPLVSVILCYFPAAHDTSHSVVRAAGRKYWAVGSWPKTVGCTKGLTLAWRFANHVASSPWLYSRARASGRFPDLEQPHGC